MQSSNLDLGTEFAADTTPILKKLTKDVVIGSTVDPKNGDTGPRAISIVKRNEALKQGQVVVCNFDDKSAAAGKGTTIEVLDPKVGSKPSRFVQSDKIEGCAGDATSTFNSVYGAGFTSGIIAGFDDRGTPGKSYGKPLVKPFSDVDAANARMYSAEYIFVSDAATGAIVVFSINDYGDRHPIQVADGFDVNKKSGWSALGPSGLQYDKKHDVLYIADGVDDNIVAFTHASNLLVKNEIEVEKHGTAFKCLHKRTTCGKLIFKGKPLRSPVALALLPNGNIIAANTQSNALVEISSDGKILDTKVVEKNRRPVIFGLAAIGTDDSNTALFYTDRKTNTLHELEQ